jgi:hypothetical protein
MNLPKQKESIEESLRLIIDSKEPEAIAFIVDKIVNESLERKGELMRQLDHENELLQKMHSILQELIKKLFNDMPF